MSQAKKKKSIKVKRKTLTATQTKKAGAVKSKAKLKAKAKTHASSTPKGKAKQKVEIGRGFMWKVLEKKREEQKLKQENHQTHPGESLENARSNYNNNVIGFGRFSGPRRRVG